MFMPAIFIQTGKSKKDSRTARRIYSRLVLTVLVGVSGGCVNYTYQPEPLQPDSFYHERLSASVDSQEFREFLMQEGIADKWPPDNWGLDELALAQLYFNPEISVAIDSIPVEQADIIIAQQRINPDLNIPLEHHSDTSGDRSPWLIGFLLDFVFEREGKREARISKAEAGAEIARINVEETAWNLQQDLQKAYTDFYAALEIRKILAGELDILGQIISVLEKRTEAGEASEFEVSLNRLDYQKILLEITRQQTQVTENFYRLTGLIGINSQNFDEENIHFNEEYFDPGMIDISRPDLNRIALQGRFDIRKALMEYNLYESELRLQIEEQYPDITLSPGFVFDQDDKIWALGTAWMLPVFHNNDGRIEKALAQRKLMQGKFRQLQAGIINRINTGWANYLASVDAYRQSLALLDDSGKNLENIRKQHELGYADLLRVLRNELESKRLERAVFELKMKVIDAFSGLQNQLHQKLRSGVDFNSIILKLIRNRLTGETEQP